MIAKNINKGNHSATPRATEKIKNGPFISIETYEMSRFYLEWFFNECKCNPRTDGQTEQSLTNIPLNFFEVGGIK